MIGNISFYLQISHFTCKSHVLLKTLTFCLELSHFTCKSHVLLRTLTFCLDSLTFCLVFLIFYWRDIPNPLKIIRITHMLHNLVQSSKFKVQPVNNKHNTLFQVQFLSIYLNLAKDLVQVDLKFSTNKNYLSTFACCS